CYWDMNGKPRAWGKKFAERGRGIHPTMIHAGVYAAVLHYLKAVDALKTDDGTKVIAKMKETPTDDPLFGKGTIRADGRKIHDMYLFEVKKPSESNGPWDLYKLRATIPAAEAFRPMDQGDCPLVKKESMRSMHQRLAAIILGLGLSALPAVFLFAANAQRIPASF